MEIYFILFLLAYILTYAMRKISIKKSLVDKVTERSSHAVATPHGGGVAIAFTWFLGISYLFYLNELDDSLYYALMVGLIIAVVSYFDDLFELSAKLRLGVQSLVAFLGLYILGGFESFNFFFFSIENQVFTNIFAFFMIIWFINLYNFLDGIDGYAGSQAIFIGLGGYLFFGDSHFLVLIFSVLGFLVWNWHKAKIFMGDVGSTLLGYTVAIFTIYYANQESSNFWIWIILFSVFWFDATLTLFRRYKNKEKLSKAHKKHAYQRLTQSGWSHDKVVLASMGINLVFLLLIYSLASIFISLSVSLLILYAINTYIDKQKGFL